MPHLCLLACPPPPSTHPPTHPGPPVFFPLLPRSLCADDANAVTLLDPCLDLVPSALLAHGADSGVVQVILHRARATAV
jgi:hypothetical protein